MFCSGEINNSFHVAQAFAAPDAVILDTKLKWKLTCQGTNDTHSFDSLDSWTNTIKWGKSFSLLHRSCYTKNNFG